MHTEGNMGRWATQRRVELCHVHVSPGICREGALSSTVEVSRQQGHRSVARLYKFGTRSDGHNREAGRAMAKRTQVRIFGVGRSPARQDAPRGARAAHSTLQRGPGTIYSGMVCTMHVCRTLQSSARSLRPVLPRPPRAAP